MAVGTGTYSVLVDLKFFIAVTFYKYRYNFVLYYSMIEKIDGSTTKQRVKEVQPVMRIRICIIKVGSGSVWRDTNPDPDPGHKQ